MLFRRILKPRRAKKVRRIMTENFARFTLTPKTEASMKRAEELVQRSCVKIEELLALQQGQKLDFSETYLFSNQGITTGFVFGTTRELNIAETKAVGFDYDYTLANYGPEICPLIYNMAKEFLVHNLRYPSEISAHQYDPGFAIRGLYYDTKRGYLLKLDYLHNVQLDAAYFGRKPLTQVEIVQAYGALHIGLAYFENLRPMIDNFCLPEACLISDIIQHFVDADLSFDPAYVYADVTKAIGMLHTSGVLHERIAANLPKFLKGKRPLIKKFLEKLKRKGKTTFLLTNSPYKFTNAGMSFLIGPEWQQLFDIVMVSADKPNWFKSERPFRRLDKCTGGVIVARVNELLPDNVYVEGSLKEFHKSCKVPGSQVLYLGDHLFSDVKEPSQHHGWRTGVIISELGKEIEKQGEPEYNANLAQLLMFQSIKRKLDLLSKDKTDTQELADEISRLRKELKTPFNAHFGSVFRTHNNPTLFAYLLQRYADIYTSNIEDRTLDIIPMTLYFILGDIFYLMNLMLPSLTYLSRLGDLWIILWTLTKIGLFTLSPSLMINEFHVNQFCHFASKAWFCHQ